MRKDHDFMTEYQKGLLGRVSRTELIKIHSDSIDTSSRSRSKERVAAMKNEFAQGIQIKKIELAKDCVTHHKSLEPLDSPVTRLRKELNLPVHSTKKSEEKYNPGTLFLPNISIKRSLQIDTTNGKNSDGK